MQSLTENYIRNARVIKITDGDTIVCLIDMGFHVHIEQPLRLARINAPELNSLEGKAAKGFLVAELPVGTMVTVQTYKNPKDKYGRWIADIHNDDGCVNDLLVQNGHAIYQTY